MKQTLFLLFTLFFFSIESIQAQVRILPDSIGVGTESPESAVHVLGEGDVSDDIVIESRNEVDTLAGSISFRRTDGTVLSPLVVKKNKSLGTISWKGFTGTVGDYATAAQIEAQTASGFVNFNQGRLLFRTNGGSSLIERMRIEDNGHVGIGTTTPDELLHVEGDARIVGKVDISASRNALASMYIGRFAGRSDTVANERSNIGVGFNALRDNLTGENNTALGISTQLQNESGNDNTSIGYFALSNNADGNDNTAIGSNALGFGAEGFGNTAVGKEVLFSATSSFNAGIGYQALMKTTTGGANVAVGNLSLVNNTTGALNTAVGDATLLGQTTGNSNTAIGAGANVGSGNLTNATAIGANALVSQSNSLVLGSGNIKVGIGTSSPNSILNVAGTLDVGVANGNGLLMTGSIDDFNIAMDNNEIMARNNGNTSTLILNREGGTVLVGGTDTDGTPHRLQISHRGGITDNGLFIERYSVSPSENWNLYTFSTGELIFLENGNEVKTLEEDGSFLTTSDRRLKKSISYLDNQLEKILQLRPATYQYKKQKDEKKQYGFIAQEVQKIYPDLVAIMNKESNEKLLGISYEEFIPLLVRGMQEQQVLIEDKDKKIKDLENRLAKIENLLFSQSSNENNTPSITITDAKLYDNQPNPFTETTRLRYFIPLQVEQANLQITTASGKVLKTIAITQRGEGQTTLEAQTLSTGHYFYSLILDGKIVETKQMILVE